MQYTVMPGIMISYGYAGNDFLSGGAGADELLGGEGNDGLNGGTGDDTLTGGSGMDQIDGGEGTDTIDFFSFGVMNQGVVVDMASRDRLRRRGRNRRDVSQR